MTDTVAFLCEAGAHISWTDPISLSKITDYFPFADYSLLRMTSVVHNGGKKQPAFQHLHVSHQLDSGWYSHGCHFAVCEGS